MINRVLYNYISIRNYYIGRIFYIELKTIFSREIYFIIIGVIIRDIIRKKFLYHNAALCIIEKKYI